MFSKFASFPSVMFGVCGTCLYISDIPRSPGILSTCLQVHSVPRYVLEDMILKDSEEGREEKARLDAESSELDRCPLLLSSPPPLLLLSSHHRAEQGEQETRQKEEAGPAAL